MEITAKMKERFCKDCGIPIRLFEEPYFMDRLKLYDRFYNTFAKWDRFIKEMEKYPSEQVYFEEYNAVKDAAISCIKESPAYERFNTEDMNKYVVTHKELPGKDIFKPSNHGKAFISIDMCKANFSALRVYDKGLFRLMPSWETFIGGFTTNQHIINSKYIRQVILGNCNPKRHITYEKYIMDGILTTLIEEYVSEDTVVFFSNDEIVIDVTDMDGFEYNDRMTLRNEIESGLSDSPVSLKVELFSLYKIGGTNGYYKKILNPDFKEKIEFKCLDSLMFPFVLRKFQGEEVTENDRVFIHEGMLAKLIEIPEIKIE